MTLTFGDLGNVENGLLPITRKLITIKCVILYHIVAIEKILAWACATMTLILVPGHLMTFKVWKNGLLLISHMLVAVLSRYLDHIIANDKTFAWKYDMMTLVLVQGHWMALKM